MSRHVLFRGSSEWKVRAGMFCSEAPRGGRYEPACSVPRLLGVEDTHRHVLFRGSSEWKIHRNASSSNRASAPGVYCFLADIEQWLMQRRSGLHLGTGFGFITFPLRVAGS